MSKPPRRPAEASAVPVDPRENPGSYIRQADGSFIQDESVVMSVQAEGPSAAAPAPEIPAESAAAIAAALADIGHEAPRVIQDAIVGSPAAEGAPDTAGGEPTPQPQA